MRFVASGSPSPTAYLDASALVKLVAREDESDALARAVAAIGIVSSGLAEAELPRALRRRYADPDELAQVLDRCGRLLARVALVTVDRDVLSRAAALADPLLRTLDAIHVATALELGDEVPTFVSYDARQLDAAAAAGLTVASPGPAPERS